MLSKKQELFTEYARKKSLAWSSSNGGDEEIERIHREELEALILETKRRHYVYTKIYRLIRKHYDIDFGREVDKFCISLQEQYLLSAESWSEVYSTVANDVFEILKGHREFPPKEQVREKLELYCQGLSPSYQAIQRADAEAEARVRAEAEKKKAEAEKEKAEAELKKVEARLDALKRENARLRALLASQQNGTSPQSMTLFPPSDDSSGSTVDPEEPSSSSDNYSLRK